MKPQHPVIRIYDVDFEWDIHDNYIELKKYKFKGTHFHLLMSMK